MSLLRSFRLVVLSAAMLRSGSAVASDGSKPPEAVRAHDMPKGPPVLQPTDPADTGVIALPGPAPVRKEQSAAKASPPVSAAPALPPPVKPAPEAVPAAPAAWLPVGPVKPADAAAGESPATRQPGVADDPTPAEFAQDGAIFLRKQIGRWGVYDAQALLGKPLRERPALDRELVENGRIRAFSDPSGNYREIELDFDKSTGLLRSVFLYPFDLTWDECRRLWGSETTSTQANKGRSFYSYEKRRLDVLVGPDGKVISLGLY
jgi:hypothetical protein